MGTVRTPIWTEQSILEIGKMTCNMVKELNLGLMALDMKETTEMEWRKAMDNIYGRMDLIMMEIGQITSSMEK